jgi:hypothetical protein
MVSSGVHSGLELLKGGGLLQKGRSTPLATHFKTLDGAPAFAQNPRLARTFAYRPELTKTAFGLFGKSGSHKEAGYARVELAGFRA